MTALRALAFGISASVQGVAATVTRPSPDDTPVITQGVWLKELVEERPVGRDFQRREPRRLMVLPRNVLATLPRGTVIEAAEQAGVVEVKTWTVDGFAEPVEVDRWRAILVAA